MCPLAGFGAAVKPPFGIGHWPFRPGPERASGHLRRKGQIFRFGEQEAGTVKHAGAWSQGLVQAPAGDGWPVMSTLTCRHGEAEARQ